MVGIAFRYIVDDVEAAIGFYRDDLGFQLDMHPAPSFAALSRDGVSLYLSSPSAAGGGGQSVDGMAPTPGGWNRLQLVVDDLPASMARLKAAGRRFRGDLITGVGGDQALVLDPSGNLVELFQPKRR
ncbi:VOC family protein [Phenylobacterium sp.]|jgi:catechol 2,3-dioxygenase-like lactoylglutathione lyase family enzyme|uniref:VOC family protein n=1 Tax=Phenylobacterium sp. TaxID=1871053 RepID=UPI002F3E34D9